MDGNGCSFADAFILDGRYQLCTCGKHIWSCRAQRTIRIFSQRPPPMLTKDDEGNRVAWSPALLLQNDAPGPEQRRSTTCTSWLLVRTLQVGLVLGALLLSVAISEQLKRLGTGI